MKRKAIDDDLISGDEWWDEWKCVRGCTLGIGYLGYMVPKHWGVIAKGRAGKPVYEHHCYCPWCGHRGTRYEFSPMHVGRYNGSLQRYEIA